MNHKKAIAYIRVSTTHQDVERQRIKFKEYCKNNNLQANEEIIDFGISGAKSDRPGYLRLQALTGKDADILVVSELSRLSRQEEILETINIIQNIVYNGLSLIFLDAPSKVYEAHSTLDITELIILLVGAFRAAQDRKEIKRKNQEGKQALLSQNPYAVVDAKIPYGYNAIYNPNGSRPKKILIENEEEVANVKKIFQLALEGYSLGKIAKYFNNRNILFRGHFVTRQLLSVLVRNILYKGIRRRIHSFDRKDNPNIIENKITPIISESDFERVNQMLKDNHKFCSTGNNYFNTLRGIIKCRCGRGMMVKDKGYASGIKKMVYRCNDVSAKDNPIHCQYKDEISYQFTNEVIFNVFKYIHNTDEIFIFMAKTEQKIYEIDEEIKGIERKIENKNIEIESLNKDNKRLIERYIHAKSQSIANAIQDEQLTIENKIHKLEDEISHCNKEKVKLITNKESLINYIDTEELSSLGNEERAELFKKHLEKVIYLPVTLMQGFYIITFKSKMQRIVAIRKTAKSPIAAILPDGYTVDMNTKLITEYYQGIQTGGCSYPISSSFKQLTIQEYFKKLPQIDNFGILDIDYSYRKGK